MMNQLRQTVFEEAGTESVHPERIEKTLRFELSKGQAISGTPELSRLAAAAIEQVQELAEATSAAEARAWAAEAKGREPIELATDELIFARSRIQIAEAQARAAEQRAHQAELRAD